MELLIRSFVAACLLIVSATAFGQPPSADRIGQDGRNEDRPPRDSRRDDREPRDRDDRPLPPAKGRPDGRPDDPPPPPGGPRFGPPGIRFGGEEMRREGGFGGGFRGFGPPGPLREGPPDDPEMGELMKQDTALDGQVRMLAERVRQARGDNRAKLKTELTELVNKHFDVRQKRRELQLKRMEDELQRLRDEIKKRNDSRESVVNSRMSILVGEGSGLDF